MRIEDRWFIQLTARMEKEVLIRVWKMRRMEVVVAGHAGAGDKALEAGMTG
jgi:hypothetical protein